MLRLCELALLTSVKLTRHSTLLMHVSTQPSLAGAQDRLQALYERVFQMDADYCMHLAFSPLLSRACSCRCRRRNCYVCS